MFGYKRRQHVHELFDSSLHAEMDAWRKTTLNKLLLLLAVINAIVTTIQFLVISYVPSVGETVVVISFGLVLFLLAFLRSIPHRVKGTFLVLFVYFGIIKQLWMHGLVSTAPISLVIIPLMVFLLFNPLAGWISGIVSALLFIAFTMIHQFEGLSALMKIGTDPSEPSVWIEIGLSLFGMLGAVLIILNQYYNLILNAVHSVNIQSRKTTAAQTATIFAMAKLAEFRDTDTGGHLERVREYSRLIAETLRKEEKYCHIIDTLFIENIYHASALHDIGKVAIPDAILHKPGKLSEEEFIVMKSHTTVGAEKLQIVYKSYPDNHFIQMGIKIALTHHEWWNGEGYPQGLRGENIPLEGRIMTLADVYDALTSERPYKKAFSHAKSRDIIVAQQGIQFDPDVVNAFIKCQARFDEISHQFQGETRMIA